MHDFRRLRVWEEAMDLAEAVYALSAGFPTDERWGLTSQMRRAAVSISSNIAEGAGRGSSKDLARFIRIALGSLLELESLLELAERLGFTDGLATLEISTEVLRRRLHAFHQSLA